MSDTLMTAGQLKNITNKLVNSIPTKDLSVEDATKLVEGRVLTHRLERFWQDVLNDLARTWKIRPYKTLEEALEKSGFYLPEVNFDSVEPPYTREIFMQALRDMVTDEPEEVTVSIFVFRDLTPTEVRANIAKRGYRAATMLEMLTFCAEQSFWKQESYACSFNCAQQSSLKGRDFGIWYADHSAKTFLDFQEEDYACELAYLVVKL